MEHVCDSAEYKLIRVSSLHADLLESSDLEYSSTFMEILTLGKDKSWRSPQHCHLTYREKLLTLMGVSFGGILVETISLVSTSSWRSIGWFAPHQAQQVMEVAFCIHSEII
ncbi:hypothetical protein RHGRI_031486 [Rhododendron griersonianum]|uniref:Uncharacterized protein n=1 Tax=Rhododendron griersonianum TaxID=479676 RepID=A0AAV6IB79_9ERIC|nr:hypothetical protein RHGRI_031486 [Rhododendron griersonianum]